MARAIAASLADDKASTAPAEVLMTGKVVELDGLEDGDDEQAQIRRAIEASLRDSERAAPRPASAPGCKADAVLPAAPRATPPATPPVVSPTPSAAAPAAAPAAVHEQIDLTGDCSAEAQYSLCGVVWHTGASAGAGHYVADVRQHRDRPAEWKRYNDAVVTTVPRDAALSQDAQSKGYIFFYVHSSAE